MFKNFVLISLFFCVLVSSVWADSQYDGWWFDADEPGSGISIEIQGDTMFMAAYSYWYGAPVWLTSVKKYDASKNAYSGPLLIWQNGSISMLPDNPVPTESGNGTISFTSDDTANMVWGVTFAGESTGIITSDIKKFMPTIAPGQSDSRLLGWWWDPAYNGMGFFIEAQGGTLFGAWYHYYPDEQAQTAFGTWLTFGGPFENGASSFSGNLTMWRGGSTMGVPPYQAPVSQDTGIPVTLDIKADGKIDMHVGGDLNLDLKLERFHFN